MNNINLKFFDSIEIETGDKIKFNMSLWPKSSTGKPYNKSECYWNGNSVVVKTTQQLVDMYKGKRFNQTNDYVISKLCYVKKIKKFEDITTLFDTKKSQTFTSTLQVDTACNEIINDLF